MPRPYVAAGSAGTQLPSPAGRGAGGEAGIFLRAISSAAWLLCAFCLSAFTAARADGEVGLVIEEDGRVRTFCVAYTGASVTGDDLLAAAGIRYDDLGTSSGSVLCSIEDTGCFDAGSYDQCWCKCSGSGGTSCVYWAFFTRDYGGPWTYSSRAFDRTMSNDGDLHAWRWGQGGVNSAPRPSDSLTFESICGHAPRGGVAPATATSPSAVTPLPATPPPAISESEASSPSTEPAATSVTRTAALTPEVSVTFTAASASATPFSPGVADRDSRDNDGGGMGSLLAFGGVALVLLGSIGAAAYWRCSHGG